MELGRRARNLIIEQYDPQNTADSYACVINKVARTNEHHLFTPLIELINDLGSPTTLLESSAKYAAAHLSLRCQPRILVDVTSLQSADLLQETDAQMAVQLIKQLFLTGDIAIYIELVYAHGEQWFRAGQFAEEIFGLPESSLSPDTPITILPGDVLLMIDASSAAPVPPGEIFDQIRQRGGRVMALGDQFSDGVLTPKALESDIFICSSQGIAKSVGAAVANRSIQLRRQLLIIYPGNNKGESEKAVNDPSNEQTGKHRDAGVRVWADLIGDRDQIDWILNMMVGEQSLDTIPHLVVEPLTQNLVYQGDQTYQLEIGGANIPVVS